MRISGLFSLVRSRGSGPSSRPTGILEESRGRHRGRTVVVVMVGDDDRSLGVLQPRAVDLFPGTITVTVSIELCCSLRKRRTLWITPISISISIPIHGSNSGGPNQGTSTSYFRSNPAVASQRPFETSNRERSWEATRIVQVPMLDATMQSAWNPGGLVRRSSI